MVQTFGVQWSYFSRYKLQQAEDNIRGTHVFQRLRTAIFLAVSNSWHHRNSVVARYHHRTQQCLLDLSRGISAEQAHDILHHCGITRQCDLSIACETKLFLGHS
ncbi:hypothetical protein VPH35_091834 [Triticum aestivum]